MKKIKDEIEAAIERGAKIHGNPASFDRLKGLGINISDGSQIISWEEYIEKTFSAEQKAKALERVKMIAGPPDIPLPAVVGIYREILKCMALGMNGAAITLSSVLVEYMLKFSTYKVEMDGFKRYDGLKWDEFENMTLAPTIIRAYKNGLLSDERKASLFDFKKKVRNPYLHYNIKKITAGVILKNVTSINLKTGESEQRDISAESDPTVQPDAKVFVDGQQVLHIFFYANDLVKEMWEKIAHLQNVASPPTRL